MFGQYTPEGLIVPGYANPTRDVRDGLRIANSADSVDSGLATHNATRENRKFLRDTLIGKQSIRALKAATVREAELVSRFSFGVVADMPRIFAWAHCAWKEAFQEAAGITQGGGEEGNGVVLELELTDPRPDRRGLLGYTARIGNVALIKVFSDATTFTALEMDSA